MPSPMFDQDAVIMITESFNDIPAGTIGIVQSSIKSLGHPTTYQYRVLFTGGKDRHAVPEKIMVIAE